MSASEPTSVKYTSGLPEKVKIGPVVYEIILTSNPTAQGPEGEELPVFGKVVFKECQITIDDTLKPVMQWQCFWHEIFHVIAEQLGLCNDDEGATDAMAYKVLEVLLDNGFIPAMETTPDGETLKIIGYTPYQITLPLGK